MKLFDIANQVGRGHWIVAEDENDAKIVFTKLFPTFKIKEIGEQWPRKDDQSLIDLLKGTEKGRIAQEIFPLTFQEMMAGKNMKPGKWYFEKKAE